MKYFQRLKTELVEILAHHHKAGDELRAPSLLNSLIIDNRKSYFLKMGLSAPGTPILLIHGFGGYFLDWSQIILPLAKEHPLYILDLPGWGFSEEIPGQEGFITHVNYIEKFCKQLNIERAHLVGISYGAALCWAFAAAKKIEITKMALLNPMPPFPLKFMESLLYKGIFMFNRNALASTIANKYLSYTIYRQTVFENVFSRDRIDELYLQLGFLMIKQPKVARTINQFAKYALQEDWSFWQNQLKEITANTLILKGKDDKVFSQESVEIFKHNIQNCLIKHLSKCGHAMIFDRPLVTTHLLKKHFRA